MSEQIIENKKLKRASLIAVIGAVGSLVLQLIGIIMYITNKTEYARVAYEFSKKNRPNFSESFDTYQVAYNTTTLISFVIITAAIILLFVFSLGLKKAKGRGKATTIIVISSIFLLIALAGVVLGNPAGILNVIFYGMLLTGSIMAIAAPTSEYEYNRLD